MAYFYYQLGGFYEENPVLPVGGKQRLSTPIATPPDAAPNARAAHSLPTYLNIPSIEHLDLTAMAYTNPLIKDLAVGDIIFTHFYVRGQAIVGLFAHIDRAASAPGFTFDIVKIPSSYDAAGNVIKDEANKVVLASGLSGDEVGEILRRRAFLDDGMNVDGVTNNDMGITEMVAGEIGIEITGLPENFDLCSQAPKLTITAVIEEPCYREFVISKDRIGACGQTSVGEDDNTDTDGGDGD